MGISNIEILFFVLRNRQNVISVLLYFSINNNIILYLANMETDEKRAGIRQNLLQKVSVILYCFSNRKICW